MYKYQIDNIRAIFKSKVTEARYFESVIDEIFPEVKKTFIIGLFVFWLYSILDYFLISKETFIIFLAIKSIPTLSTIISIYFLNKIKNNYQIFYNVILIYLFIFLATTAYFFARNPVEPLQMALE
jgi:hypothetical protein